ncbi:Astacin-like metalloprotease toxin [Leptotrombidium deliense]|uniref:Metalloendopeptidase n=1 Tax=Leptotrombidium deliense TaxID=299467 RepID=A0A443SHS7_9ACAR|nr:Astacin-like metalloprotease toxin [Leptotrombidium deliense]
MDDPTFFPKEISSICNPKLEGGDMIGMKDGGTMDKARLWPNGIIPFKIRLDLLPEEELIFRAMRHIEARTCIRFKPRTNEKDYVHILRGMGCFSYIGKRRKGGVQPLSIGQGCEYFGTVVHELLHAVGFHHEQNRKDRDKYVKILWQNIKPEFKNQFNKLNNKYFPQFFPFDYHSIMLYGSFTFSKDRKSPTMIAKSSKVNRILPEVFRKTSMSIIDAKRVRRLYNCDRNRPKTKLYKITEFYA